ncbi:MULTISPECIES: ATP-binding protein [Thermococcus]|uniref:ArsR family transcriptional regulator n=1 Tax=Thermococcus barossii TaxID=54077 RepID=A0A2Z2MGM7_9EURY|nr:MULTISPECIES: ATP-binding protein [Thermococcus]ASJ04833.1 ArsR family transcriptional regulator [Thermococcus barossii]NJE76897.1 ATP-binding protein [Thermococcus sp. ES12]
MSRQKFIDRERELEFLERAYSSDRAEFLVIYGRRRIGKTELLLHFARDKPHVYFLATERPYRDNLRELQRLLSEFLGDRLFGKVTFEDVDELLMAFTERIGDEKVILIIDEFPLLIEHHRPVLSLLQKAWDLKLSETRIMLILCGSSVSAMESEVLAYKSPLYGRRTGQWRLTEIPFFHIGEFLPGYTVENLVKVYGITGGIPAYLLQFDPKKDFDENVVENVLSKGAFLYEEAEFLLREELREPANYFAILQAIASGRSRFGEIVNSTGLDKSLVSKYLAVLQRLGIVEREVPVTATLKEASKRGLYSIADNYFAFWFRYVLPNKGYLEAGLAEEVWERSKSDFNAYMGSVFEKLIRNPEVFLRLTGFRFTKLGRWWRKGEEIDLLALNEMEKRALLIEVKWKELSEREARGILKDLERKAGLVGLEDWEKSYGLMAKSLEGKKELRAEGWLVWDLEDFKEKG